MPSAQDCAERLREQAYRTLSPQVRDLEQELKGVSSSLLAGLEQIERKLESLRKIELPTTESILTEILDERAPAEGHGNERPCSFHARFAAKGDTGRDPLVFVGRHTPVLSASCVVCGQRRPV